MNQRDQAKAYVASLVHMSPTGAFAASRMQDLVEEACNPSTGDGSLSTDDVLELAELTKSLRNFLMSLARTEQTVP